MSDQELTEQPLNGAVPDDSQPVSPGARLAAYRQERGWTVEQVASQLNLAPRQVVAIESDDYPALPGMPIVRGFIRAYAKLLKVDATPLLATLGGETVFANHVATGKNLEAPFSEKRLPSMADRPGLSSKWMIGLLLVLLIGVAVWASGLIHFPDMSSSPSSQMGGDAESAPGAAASVQTEVTDGGKPLVQTTPVDGASSQSASDAGSAALLPAPTADAGQPVQPAPPAAAVAPTSVPEAVRGNVLTLKVREESWIEIRRAGDKKQVFSRLVKAGETESLEINEPMSVVIGNAAGVDATLRGEPIALKSGTKTNVARLRVK